MYLKYKMYLCEMKLPFLSNTGLFKVMIAVAGIVAISVVSFFIFSVLFVWGVGYANGEAELANMVIGSWETNTDSLGTTPVIEVFNIDGTWVCGNSDDILRKGKWQHVDDNKIKINETEVAVDNISEPVNHERIIEIVDLKYNRIVCKEGNREFVLNRIRVPVPKRSIDNN